MKIATALVIAISMLFASSCDISGCNKIIEEKNIVYRDYLDLREFRYQQWKKELSAWNKAEIVEEEKKQQEIKKCENDPYEYYRVSKLKIIVDFYGGYTSYKEKGNLREMCETLQGTLTTNGTRPEDDSGSYPPAVAKYVIAMTVIKNNPKCFSATEVAEAEQELIRLKSN